MDSPFDRENSTHCLHIPIRYFLFEVLICSILVCCHWCRYNICFSCVWWCRLAQSFLFLELTHGQKINYLWAEVHPAWCKTHNNRWVFRQTRTVANRRKQISNLNLPVWGNFAVTLKVNPFWAEIFYFSSPLTAFWWFLNSITCELLIGVRGILSRNSL